MEVGQLNGNSPTADDLIFSENFEIRLMRWVLTQGIWPCFDDDLPGACVLMEIPSLSEG